MIKINLVGHPYAPIGMGEHIRCTFRALKSIGINSSITDIYRLETPNFDDELEFGFNCVENRSSSINIFHINGDEVDQALDTLNFNNEWSGYNVIYPAWELSEYPEEWASKIDRFDEIWAPSNFILKSLEKTCTKPIFHMPLACEVRLDTFFSRRYFRIPESHYVFLFFFDLRSYLSRKNPNAVIESFRRLLHSKKYAKTSLVLKVNGADKYPLLYEQILESVKDISEHIIMQANTMSDIEVKNLVRCCDCFISLHRSEGFGRGIAEAMSLGKPVIATGYSGNMDFMNEAISFPVPYELVNLTEGDYPYWENQKWAEPDIDYASKKMLELLDNPELGYAIGKLARSYMYSNFSYRPIGYNYLNRIKNIL